MKNRQGAGWDGGGAEAAVRVTSEGHRRSRRASASAVATLVNLGLYQVGWFVAIVCAAGGSPGWAAAVPLGLAALHAALAKRTANELRFLAVAGLVGIAVDSLVSALSAVAPRGSGLLPGLPPLWLTALWVQLATLVRFALRWLAGRYLVAAFLGAVGGPVAFLVGERMGAATFPNGPVFAIAILALAWAIATPLLFGVSRALGGGEGSGAYRFEH